MHRPTPTNLEELLALAGDYKLPVDVPFAELTEEQRRLVVEGVPERNFGGLNGFFRWLERRKYKMHLRVFLSRWRKYRALPCLRRSAAAARGARRSCGRQELRRRVRVEDSRCASLSSTNCNLPEWRRQVARPLLKDVRSRLTYLGRRRSRLFGARPVAANAQRWRSPACCPHLDARFQPGRYAVCAR